jgi:hypothetical protein
VSPRINASPQRERKPTAAPLAVWELDWQDCPVAFKLKGLARRVVSVKIPVVFPPGDMPIPSSSGGQHWFITHRQDAARVLLLVQQVQSQIESTSRDPSTVAELTLLHAASCKLRDNLPNLFPCPSFRGDYVRPMIHSRISARTLSV